MNPLSVNFAGLNLINPFLLASGPATRDKDSIRSAFKAGWAGAVTKTISLKPPVSPTPRLYLFESIDSLINIELISEFTHRQWANWIKLIKKEFPKQALIASIMGSVEMTEWQTLAKEMEKSGADALELNVSCPHGMPEKAMGSLIGQDKTLVAEIVMSVKECVKIPVIVKLTPNVTDLAEIARSCEISGADALSGINTVKAFTGIDINTFSPKLSVYGKSAFGGYGGKAIKPIALRCTAEMALSTKLPVSAIGGISTWEDAVEFMLIGASCIQVCTAAIAYGINIIEDLKDGLSSYLKKHKFKSIRDIIGKSKDKIVRFSELTLHPKQVSVINKSKCIANCHQCYIVCRAAGFNAITLDNAQKPFVNISLCKGCGLCISVCHFNAIRITPCKRK
ncbi:MAG: NAD-dependent dihydropyrimidine dehydrogenase subunit PreA [Planctomycetes bacterium]|nr:NAD-dependent dihydropyrimidine dehydrogenase subunit PreA [Planctomycetota bacterium]